MREKLTQAHTNGSVTLSDTFFPMGTVIKLGETAAKMQADRPIVSVVYSEGEVFKRFVSPGNGEVEARVPKGRAFVKINQDRESEFWSEYARLFGVVEIAKPKLPNKFGKDFEAHGFYAPETGNTYIVLTKGDLSEHSAGPVPVRIHSACATGDVFGSHRCECGPQIAASLRKINKLGKGIVIWAPHQEGRGIGALEKLRAYELQEEDLQEEGIDPLDTVDANLALDHDVDTRDYKESADVIKALIGFEPVNLLSGNDEKESALRLYGVNVVAKKPVKAGHRQENARYRDTKRTRLKQAI